jgi:hypothetical protein
MLLESFSHLKAYVGSYTGETVQTKYSCPGLSTRVSGILHPCNA